MHYQKSSTAQNSSKKQARCAFDSYMVAQIVTYFDTSLDWFCRSFKHISEAPRREFRKMVRCFSARWSFATMTFAMSECESRDLLCLICGIPEISIAVSNFMHFSKFSTATEQLQNSYRVRVPRYASGTVRNSAAFQSPSMLFRARNARRWTTKRQVIVQCSWGRTSTAAT